MISCTIEVHVLTYLLTYKSTLLSAYAQSTPRDRPECIKEISCDQCDVM